MTVNQIIEKYSSSDSKHIAIIDFFDPSNKISYAQLANQTKKFSETLTYLGVTRQSRIAIVIPSGVSIALALLGVSFTAIAVPLSHKMTKEEYLFYLDCSKCSFLIIQEGEYPNEVILAAKKLRITIIPISKNGEILINRSKLSNADSTYEMAKVDDTAIIFLTSGSTGIPKIVPLTHLNVCTSAAQVSNSLNLTDNDRCLCMWEQYHIGGFVDLLLAPLYSGGLVICAGKFNANFFFTAIEQYDPTWFQGVPTTLTELLKLGNKNQLKKHNLRFIRSVAAALSPTHMMDIEKYFNVPVIQTFGMTEASPLITTNELPPGLRKAGSVGKTCGTEIAIMDSKNNLLPPLAHGEIAIKGSNVFSGYENSPEANDAQFYNGWFFTGDVGYFDNDGFLFLSGRSKELINKGGEKVSPYEIEDILNKHSSISESAIFSVPHSTLGEDIAAAVVLNENNSISPEELKKHISKYLSEFKIPTTFLVLDELPKNNIGKILRSDLKKIYDDMHIKKVRVEPENPTQKLLLQIWSAELYNNLISIDDDFQAAGGDSLAYTRLLAIVQQLFGVDLSEQPYLEISSIEKMSRIIQKSKNAIPHLDDVQDLRKTLYENSFLKINEYDNFRSIVDCLKDQNSLQSFINFRESLLTYATPQELKSITNKEYLGLLSEKILDNHLKWSRNLINELDICHSSQSWSRQTYGSHSFLYKSDQSNEEKLIIALTGSAGRLMMPIYRFLQNLNPQYDLLIVQIPESGHYTDGVPGHGNDLRSFSEWVYDNFHEKPYKKIITFGVSAGALPSLCMNFFKPFDRIILVAPELIDRHPILKTMLLNSSTNLPALEQKTSLVFSEKNKADLLAVKHLNLFLKNPKKYILENNSSHLVLHEIWKKGLLKKFLSTVLD